MCELCDKETRPKARQELAHRANELVELAGLLRNLAGGELDPHGYDAGKIRLLAVHTIRYLTAEWL